MSGLFSDELKQQVLSTKSIRYLSSVAIATDERELYTYLHRKFGATWVIESHVRQSAPRVKLIVDVVDAKTSLVVFTNTLLLNESGDAEENQLVGFVKDIVSDLGSYTQDK